MTGPVLRPTPVNPGLADPAPADPAPDASTSAANNNDATVLGTAAGKFAGEAILGDQMPQAARIEQIESPAVAGVVPANSNDPFLSVPPSQSSEDEDGATRASLIAAAGSNPDRALAVRKLAATTGLPIDVVERNFDQITAQATLDQAESHLAGNPSLKMQMADPAFAKVAIDDVGPLGKIETGVQLFRTPRAFGARGRAFMWLGPSVMDEGTRPTDSDFDAAIRNFKKGGGGVIAQALRGVDVLATGLLNPNNVSAYKRILQSDPSYVWRPQTIGEKPIIAIQDRRRGGRLGPATYYVRPGDDLYTFITDPDKRQAMLAAEEKKIDPSDHFLYKSGVQYDRDVKAHNVTTPEQDASFWTGMFPHAAGEVAAYGTVGVATDALAGPVVGTAVVGGMATASGADQGYQDAKSHGADQATAMQAAQADAAVAAAISAVPGAKQVERLAVKITGPLAHKLGENLSGIVAKGAANSVVGATQAATQQFGTNIVAQSVFDPSRSWLQDITQPAVPAAIGNLFLGFLPHLKLDGTISHPANENIAPEHAPIVNAAAAAQAALYLIDGARQSALRQRDGDLFAATVQHMAEEHDLEALNVSATALQNLLAHPDVDGPELLQYLPSVQKQLPSAIASGTPLSIPVPEFVYAFSESEVAPLLAPYIRPVDGGPNLVELVQAFRELHRDDDGVSIPRASDPRTIDQNWVPEELSDYDSNLWGKHRSEFKPLQKVIAEFLVNDRHFSGSNPRARAPEARDKSKLTLISDHVAEKQVNYKKQNRANGHMGDAHAEIEALQKAYDAYLTTDADGLMNIKGRQICSICRTDIPLMAERAGLKSLTVQNIDRKGVLRTYFWQPGEKLVLQKREQTNDGASPDFRRGRRGKKRK